MDILPFGLDQSLLGIKKPETPKPPGPAVNLLTPKQFDPRKRQPLIKSDPYNKLLQGLMGKQGS